MPPPPEADRLPRGGPARESGVNEVSRRTLLAGLAGAGFLARTVADAINVDRALPDLLYPQQESRFVAVRAGPITAAAARLSTAQSMCFNGGIGQYAGVARPLAERFASGPYTGASVSFSAYAASGIDLDQLTTAYEQYERSAGGLHMVCNSMSLLTLCNIGRIKWQRANQAQTTHWRSGGTGEVEYPFKALDSLTCITSPTGIEDVYNGDLIQTVLEKLNPSGSMSDKMIVKFLDKWVNHRHGRQFKEVIEEAAKETFDRLPPRMWLSQIRQVVYTDALENPDVFAGMITDNTRMAYVLPRDASRDRTVRALQGCQKVAAIADHFGCSFDVFYLEDAGHADVHRLCENPAYHEWASRAVAA